jgi:hypothetical protein
MKNPRWIERTFDQQALDRDGRREVPSNFKDECALEKHRRFHYLRRREEEERQNRDNL